MSRPDSNASPWLDFRGDPPSAVSPLPRKVDVCVVGAGIAGLSIAYPLAVAGRSVLVLDKGPIGGGETAMTTAHLAAAIDDRFGEVERIHGLAAVRLAYESHSAAIRWIEHRCQRDRIACDFEALDGILFPADEAQRKVIEREWDTIRRAELPGVERLQRPPSPRLGDGPCLRFPGQAQFHPLKYLDGLSRSIERAGGLIATGRRVTSIRGGAPAEVDVEGEGGETSTILADAVAVATNAPIHLTVGIHTKQAPYLTYAVGLRVPRGSVPRALLWDADDPYHYVRTQPLDDGDDLLIVGGEDHKTGQAGDGDDRHDRLEGWARARFPVAGEVCHRWSGQVFETIDGLGFIGRCPGGAKNLYIATGDSGMGMTHGTIAGLLISDLILGRPNPWEGLYDPARKPVKAAWDYVKENVDVAVQYTDLVTGGDVASVDEIAPGSGAVVRRGLAKLAVYRDDDGNLHECSAVCTHLGCVVHWNDSARTWDCPCHGSRFDPKGCVLTGPATSDLARTEHPAAVEAEA